jgi:hypothetical protein
MAPLNGGMKEELFSLWWRSLGPTMGRHEAGRWWRLAHFAPVREEEEGGRLGREFRLGRPRGRGPVGTGGAVGWGRKEVVAARPKGRMGWLAARPIGLKVKEKFFFE